MELAALLNEASRARYSDTKRIGRYATKRLARYLGLAVPSLQRRVHEWGDGFVQVGLRELQAGVLQLERALQRRRQVKRLLL